jgi:hypothetical protein
VDDDYFDLMRRPSPSRPGSAGAGRPPGVTVLIPTYTPAGGGRVRQLRLALGSVRRAARLAGDLPVAFVVADNGLTPADAREVAAALRATGCPALIVDATQDGPPGERRRYTAAGARNAALAALAARPADSPLRRRHLLFLDDDSALAPGALAALVSTLDGEPEAVAACPRVVPVADPGRWLADQPTVAAVGSAPPRRLPGPIRAGHYDLLSVTSHGSLITGRTVGLLVRQDPVLERIVRRGPLFYPGTPFGSSEDMLAMAVLAQLGRLWSVPAALVADEARDQPGPTRTQQFAWGFDHAWLSAALLRAGALEPGVQVLSWTPGGWRHDVLPGGGRSGILINPDELHLGHRLLRAILADPAAAAGLLGADADRVRSGLPLLGRMLRLWRAGSSGGTGRARPANRPDLPALAPRDWSGLREGLDALLAHLAGNVAGSFANGGESTDGPFLFGARQPATTSTTALPDRPVRTGHITLTTEDRSPSWSIRSVSSGLVP